MPPFQKWQPQLPNLQRCVDSLSPRKCHLFSFFLYNRSQVPPHHMDTSDKLNHIGILNKMFRFSFNMSDPMAALCPVIEFL